jgi:hypothetical protein
MCSSILRLQMFRVEQKYRLWNIMNHFLITAKEKTNKQTVHTK